MRDSAGDPAGARAAGPSNPALSADKANALFVVFCFIR